MNIQLKNIDDSEQQRICDRASDNISRLTSELNRFRSQRTDLAADIQNRRNRLANTEQDLADARIAAVVSSVPSTSVVGSLISGVAAIAAGRRVGELSQDANDLQAQIRNMEFELRRVVADIDNREDLIRQVRAVQSRHDC